jgi:hypothetical protein
MKWELAISAVMLVVGMVASSQAVAQAPLHTRTEFSFTVAAPFDQVAPLFGAHEERKWASGWNPQFIHPIPAHDQPGMVFTVPKGQFASVWVNTAFDLEAGHIQYAYLVSETMTTLIDIHLTRVSAQKTEVTVVYERTALMPEANEHVRHFAKDDQGAGKEWEEAISGYLAKTNAHAERKCCDCRRYLPLV